MILLISSLTKSLGYTTTEGTSIYINLSMCVFLIQYAHWHGFILFSQSWVPAELVGVSRWKTYFPIKQSSSFTTRAWTQSKIKVNMRDSRCISENNPQNISTSALAWVKPAHLSDFTLRYMCMFVRLKIRCKTRHLIITMDCHSSFCGLIWLIDNWFSVVQVHSTRTRHTSCSNNVRASHYFREFSH